MFWRTALKLFPALKSSPGNKPTHQFKTIRNKLYDIVPDATLEIGYKNKATGEIKVVKALSTPVSQYSPADYEKLFEIASVKVSNLMYIDKALKKVY